MPYQDAQGRWISDDGRQYWDGQAWRPNTVQAPAQGRSMALPAVLIGCGFALLVLIVLGIGGVLIFNTSDFRQGFCESWNNNPRQAATPCPLAR